MSDYMHGFRCQACERGSRKGVAAWDLAGETVLLCWMCAAQLLAAEVTIDG